jgi:hypothetical protein
MTMDSNEPHGQSASPIAPPVYELAEGEGCMVCEQPAIARSVQLQRQGFAWCLDHFAEVVTLQAQHQMARTPEVDLLVGYLHGTYHRLQEAMEAIEEVAKRFPECSTMPDPLPAEAADDDRRHGHVG